MPDEEKRDFSYYHQSALEKIKKRDWQEEEVIFRGLSDKEYRLESAAHRRIKKLLRGLYKVGDYTEAILIEKVKMQQWHKRDGRELKDLEILAYLQHQGAATPLMDWSRSFAVALWFACDENKDEEGKDKDGRVVMMNILANLDKKITYITSENMDKAYAKLKENKIYYFEPASTLERIISQSSVFLFSKKEPLVLGIEEVLIPHSEKKKLREEISLLFGIDKTSLYDDFVGFAARNKPEEKITLDEIIETTTKMISSARSDDDKELLASSYDTRAITWIEKGNFDKALADFNKVVELYPKNALAYINRGSLRLDRDEIGKALEDFNQAIELAPRYALAYIGRGDASFKRNEFDEAIVDYDRAIELDPENVLAYVCRGTTRFNRNEFDEAMADYDKAIELDPENVLGYVGRGTLRGNSGEFDEALADFDKAIELAAEWGADRLLGQAKELRVITEARRKNSA